MCIVLHCIIVQIFAYILTRFYIEPVIIYIYIIKYIYIYIYILVLICIHWYHTHISSTLYKFNLFAADVLHTRECSKRKKSDIARQYMSPSFYCVTWNKRRVAIWQFFCIVIPKIPESFLTKWTFELISQ